MIIGPQPLPRASTGSLNYFTRSLYTQYPLLILHFTAGRHGFRGALFLIKEKTMKYVLMTLMSIFALGVTACGDDAKDTAAEDTAAEDAGTGEDAGGSDTGASDDQDGGSEDE